MGIVIAFAIFTANNNTLNYYGPIAVINGVDIPIELARTETERERGLSGRASLDEGSGMLFIFEKPGVYSFWMPDMRFPIDIIWINGGKIVDISENVSNEFDPAEPVYYFPSAPIQYVLEVNAGFAKSNGIKVGDAVILTGI